MRIPTDCLWQWRVLGERKAYERPGHPFFIDSGPKSRELFKKTILESKTILWFVVTCLRTLTLSRVHKQF